MRIIKKIFKWIGILIGVLLTIFIVLLVIPEKETIQSIQPRESTRYWDMNEGFRIAFTQLEGIDSLNKTPVIFLHGGPGGYIHSSIIETLGSLTSKGHDVYLYDQRGSGLSDRFDKYSDVTFEKHLLDLHEIITQKIKAPKAILIGQSFGCIIISHYSTRNPQNVEKIVFGSPGVFKPEREENGLYIDLNSVYPTPDSLNFIEPYNYTKDVNSVARKPKMIAAVIGAHFFDKKLISDKQMDRMLNSLVTNVVNGVVCDPKNALPEEGGAGLYAYIGTNSADYPKIRDQIKDVQVPILVLQGQCDFIPYAASYEYVDLYPNSQYKLIENAGHEIWWEQKEEYIKEIIKFIEE